MHPGKPIIILFAGLALFLCICGCEKKTVEPKDVSTEVTAPEPAAELTDKPIEDFRVELLEIAFDTATKIPVKPHIKDRSLAQEKVILACIELDQAARAGEYTGKIDNWRRGLCYAYLAFYSAEKGFREPALEHLARAEKIAGMDFSQEWRRDRIRVTNIQTRELLGLAPEGEASETEIVESEKGKEVVTPAVVYDAALFDERTQKLDDLLAKGDFDLTKNALTAYAQLFNFYYDDGERRNLAEEKIKTSWDKLPGVIRVDLLMQMAGYALDHSDPEKALALLNEAQEFLEGGSWPLENRIPYVSKLAELRFRAGDKERAQSDADMLLALYEEQGDTIVNIWRAGALRPLAEACQSMGDTEKALRVYKTAVEEGVDNPNSRPRAEDLSATCCSMALSGVEPDAELWERIRGIHKGLKEPW